MKKEDLLQELSDKVSSGEITRDEVMRRLKSSAAGKGLNMDLTQMSVTKMLYALGAVVVLVGIIFLVYQVWEDIGSVGRIAITLGLGILLTAMGSVLLKGPEKEKKDIGLVFHAMGGVLIPGGTMVSLYEMYPVSLEAWPVAIAFGIITLFYVMLNLTQRNVILSFYTIGNATAFLYLLVEALIDGQSYRLPDIYTYLTMVIGLMYLLLSYSFRRSWNSPLCGLLNFFGISAFLGATFSKVFDSVAWEMAYFLVIIGALLLAVQTKSRSILAVSTLFLIAHFSYITSQYFADSLGWPVCLIILGFVFIGLGYASITINKKYIA